MAAVHICLTGVQAAPASSSSATRRKPLPRRRARRVEYLKDGACVACATGTTSAGGDATECTASSSASSPGPPASSPESSTPSSSSAQEKKETAEKTRDSILADIADPAVKKKAKLLADAAIAGETIQRLSAKLSAADPDAACTSAYSKAAVSSGKGACVAKPDTSAAAGRRRLSATTYDVELMFKSSEVSDAALAAAANELKANGVEGVTSQTSVDPMQEAQGHPRHRHQQASNV